MGGESCRGEIQVETFLISFSIMKGNHKMIILSLVLQVDVNINKT